MIVFSSQIDPDQIITRWNRSQTSYQTKKEQYIYCILLIIPYGIWLPVLNHRPLWGNGCANMLTHFCASDAFIEVRRIEFVGVVKTGKHGGSDRITELRSYNQQMEEVQHKSYLA